MLQIPCTVVHPTELTKTSTDRDVEEAKVIFPNVKDTGLDINAIPMVIVHNGLHHFVGAQYPQPTFKNGILDICHHLQQARFIADSLKVGDEVIKGVVSQHLEQLLLCHTILRDSSSLLAQMNLLQQLQQEKVVFLLHRKE